MQIVYGSADTPYPHAPRARRVALILVAIVTGLLVVAGLARAAHLHPERWYQERWCASHGGVMEYRLDNDRRVDCLTDTYAVEVDFAHKWFEGLGQALHYSAKTGKRPLVLLIIEQPEDRDCVDDLIYTIRSWQLPVDVEMTGPDGAVSQ